MMKRNWYAVYTKSHSELKVTALFTKKKIDSYCPLIQAESNNYGRRKLVYKPLFPSFVFVNITEAQMNYIRQTNDVINFLYWINKPAVIKESEIKAIEYFTGAHSNITLEKVAVNPAGMPSTINEPLIMANNNSLLSIKAINIKMSLPSLGYVMVAEAGNAAGIHGFEYEASKMVS